MLLAFGLDVCTEFSGTRSRVGQFHIGILDVSIQGIARGQFCERMRADQKVGKYIHIEVGRARIIGFAEVMPKVFAESFLDIFDEESFGHFHRCFDDVLRNRLCLVYEMKRVFQAQSTRSIDDVDTDPISRHQLVYTWTFHGKIAMHTVYYHAFLTIIYVTRILGDGVDKNVSQETASCGRQSADIEIL